MHVTRYATPLTFFLFFFNDTATTEIYTLSLHDALPISPDGAADRLVGHHVADDGERAHDRHDARSEEHTSELQSPCNLVCRLLLEKKKNNGWTTRQPSLSTSPWNWPSVSPHLSWR